jgi:molecular chaperone DnaK (HSP70)
MGKIKSIPTSKTGEPHPFKINFIYDNNGMIKLSAYIPTTNQKLDIKFNDSEISMSEEEKKIAIERIEDMWMKNNLLSYYTKIIHNIQKYINNNELSDEEVTQLQKLKDQIERSLNTGNRYLAEEAEKELKKYGIGN